jgi:transposase
MDLRERVVAACDRAREERVVIAAQYAVSTAWIRRLLQRRRETGQYGPRTTQRGRKPVFAGRLAVRLEALVAQQPDATLAELRQRSGVTCSLPALCKTLQRMGYRRKKRRFGPLSKTVPMSDGSVGNGCSGGPKSTRPDGSSLTKAGRKRT